MPDIWKPQSIEVYQSWIQALQDEASDSLSMWEVSFLSSLLDRLSSGRNLTQRQADVLEKIYSENTK